MQREKSRTQPAKSSFGHIFLEIYVGWHRVVLPIRRCSVNEIYFLHAFILLLIYPLI